MEELDSFRMRRSTQSAGDGQKHFLVADARYKTGTAASVYCQISAYSLSHGTGGCLIYATTPADKGPFTILSSGDLVHVVNLDLESKAEEVGTVIHTKERLKEAFERVGIPPIQTGAHVSPITT